MSGKVLFLENDKLPADKINQHGGYNKTGIYDVFDVCLLVTGLKITVS